MGYEDKVVVVVGPQTAYEIPLVQFLSLQDHYATSFKVYETFREKHRNHNGHDPIRGRGLLPVDYNAAAHGLWVINEQKD